MDDEGAKAAGRWIAKARKVVHGWRQEELAVATGLSRTSISQIEQGKRGPNGWNQSTVNAIEDALGVPRGTIRRVASGEDLHPLDLQGVSDIDELTAVVRKLAAQVDQLDRRVRALGG